MDIFSVVRLAADRGASDLHLVSSRPPLFRIHGSLQPVEDIPPLTPDDIEQAFHGMASEKEKTAFSDALELDFGYGLSGVGRLRCNVARQQGTVSMVIRLIPDTIPDIGDLGLPDICQELVQKPRGLVIVSGPTGSGKTTTLAAMIKHLNSLHNRRVVTIEDPIEYVYTSDRCTITQRELGNDTLSFAQALKHVLRQDPDVILVGEMRDQETAAAVLAIAETGHLILTTGHAPSAPQAIERVIDLFPPHERPLVQSRLASLLVGILCQALVPRADGTGRIAAIEVMMASPAIRNNIREGRLHQLPNAMLTQSRLGTVLLDQSLVKLYRQGIITLEDALAVCNDPEEVTRLLKGQLS